MLQYLPFFRKYRPQSFRDVVGQENLVKALSNAIELGRIANAYLFCGPRGTGKTSSARILAKSLNCVQGPTLDPCQKCPSCLDITNTSGLDVIEIDAATNRGIADAKELIAQVQYAPMNGKYKIFIIDEVHMLSTEAFNALLKTFEEPPQNVIFILATTEPHKVIETIVSRCQRFDFRRIVVEDIVAKLRDISKIESIKITDEALYTIAKNVSGGLRDSLALLDQVSILGVKEEITKSLIEDLLGKITFTTLLELLDKVLKKDLESALKTVDSIYSKGNEPRNLCENFIEFLRNVVVVLDSKNPTDVLKFTTFGESDVREVLSAFSKEQKDEIIALLIKTIEFYREIKTSTNPYLWVELMVIELSSNETRIVSAQAPVLQKEVIIKPEKKVEVKVEVAAPPPETAVEAAPEAPKKIEKEPESIQPEIMEVKVETKAEEKVVEKIEEKRAQSFGPNVNNQEVWSKIVNSIDSVPAKFFFSGVARLVSVADDAITIGFVHQNSLVQAKTDSKFKPLEKALGNVFEKKLNINMIQITKDTQAVEAQIVNVKKSEAPPPYEVQPLEDYVEKGAAIEPEPPKEEEPPSEPVMAVVSEPKDVVKAAYSQKTREMIENFNGKIVD